ncbi:type II toxin-antitoxin system death-on-curing family toxin [Egicoccus sp. AB-alg2]|uniref:type II toxin-antitoxin system death-on-curing family toxin n=1 Tax=Egicoccus sp. AB-alg2 TaxID=3242693 RepID=UPI00359ED7C7
MHDRLLDAFGGAAGLRDAEGLDAALNRPRSGYYEDEIAEAAALLESLLVNHPFVDGNKRTAFAVADIFLRLNGRSLKVETDEAYGVIVGVLEDSKDRFARLEAWLRRRTATKP